MNADDMMKYGHQTLMAALDAVASDIREVEGACGVWSVRDILAHLASYEKMFIEAMLQVQGETHTPTLDSLFEHGDAFNDVQVAERADKSYEELLEEYLSAHEQAAMLMAAIPLEKRRQNGLIAWYGDAYDFEDFFVYTIYAHKREHSGQINVFKDKFA